MHLQFEKDFERRCYALLVPLRLCNLYVILNDGRIQLAYNPGFHGSLGYYLLQFSSFSPYNNTV